MFQIKFVELDEVCISCLCQGKIFTADKKKNKFDRQR